jgi:hypothetical protein
MFSQERNKSYSKELKLPQVRKVRAHVKIGRRGYLNVEVIDGS